MAFIRIIEPDEAVGPLKQEYEAAVRRSGRVYNILKIMSLNPRSLRTAVWHYRAIMHGSSPLSRAQREMLAVVVSRANACHY